MRLGVKEHVAVESATSPGTARWDDRWGRTGAAARADPATPQCQSADAATPRGGCDAPSTVAMAGGGPPERRRRRPRAQRDRAARGRGGFCAPPQSAKGGRTGGARPPGPSMKTAHYGKGLRREETRTNVRVTPPTKSPPQMSAMGKGRGARHNAIALR
eukprot:gene14659-biopygen9172